MDMRRILRDRFIDLLVISIPLFRFLEIEIIGRLFMTEIILVFLFPILLLNNSNFLSAPLPKMMTFLISIWLAGQIFTDLILHIPFQGHHRCSRGNTSCIEGPAFSSGKSGHSEVPYVSCYLDRLSENTDFVSLTASQIPGPPCKKGASF